MKGEITYELKDPAYCYKIVDVPKDVFSLATDLTKWLSEVEICKVTGLTQSYSFISLPTCSWVRCGSRVCY